MSRKSILTLAPVLALALLLPAPAARAAINAVDNVPAATLLLPYFEVSLSGSPSTGVTTVLQVGNASATPVLAHLTLWTDQGVPTRAVDVYIGGKDVVEIDLRLLLNGVVPQRATNPWTGNVGSGSGAAVAFPGCPASWPEGGRLSAADVAGLKAAHTGAASALFGGSCGGKTWGDNVARGYVTIDAVNSCSPVTTFPSTPGYFAAGGTGIASNRNVLFGEYSIVDRANNYDTGDTLVHVEASATSPWTTVSGRYTFYGRLASVNGSAVDNREALFTQWMARYMNGGTFTSGTKLTVWRDPGPRSAWACGSAPAPLSQAGALAFDEEENPSQLPGHQLFPLASESVDLASPERIPLPFSFGFLYADLNLSAAVAPFADLNQAWVSPRFLAEGRFAAGIGGFPLKHPSDDQNPIIFWGNECNDGVDNDGDGFIDFPADPGCASASGIESPACDDKVDNDGDGKVDFPADFGCTAASDPAEFAQPNGCRDGLDNDGDGLIDFPSDPDCGSSTDPSESPDCSDEVENDNDGLVDFPADTGCASAADRNEKAGTTTRQCGDGLDNDGDGHIDFLDDPGCISFYDDNEYDPN